MAKIRGWMRVVGSSAAIGAAAAAWGQTSGGTAEQPAAPAAPHTGTALFDPKADAVADVQAARERAKANHRNVLILWGDNQARFCGCLHDQLRSDPRLRTPVADEFELVLVDTARFEKNVELGKHYQTDFVALGVPNLTIVDARSDSAVGVLPGRDAILKPPLPPRCFDSAAIAKFLESGKAPQPDAATLLAEGQARAKASGRPLLVSFGESGCTPCDSWNHAVADRVAGSALVRLFTLCRIDTRRTPGAAELKKKLSGPEPTGSPSLWLTFVDAEGKPMAGIGKMPRFDPRDSGKPVTEWMRAAAAGKMTDEEFESIVLKLVAPLETQGASGGSGGGGGVGGGGAGK